MLGIIGGTSLFYSDLPGLEERVVHTPFGNAKVTCGDVAILMRHQHGLPPHRINFPANLSALALLGVDRIIAFGSAGSLKREITPGSVVVPDDYLSFAGLPSIHEHAIGHVCPGLDSELKGALINALPAAQTCGVYAQSPGPRLETMAEVRVLAEIADVVGMTVASEATLACELGMRFAAVCTVDNYAHGLADEVLSYEQIVETSKSYSERTGDMLEKIIRVLA